MGRSDGRVCSHLVLDHNASLERGPDMFGEDAADRIDAATGGKTDNQCDGTGRKGFGVRCNREQCETSGGTKLEPAFHGSSRLGLERKLISSRLHAIPQWDKRNYLFRT